MKFPAFVLLALSALLPAQAQSTPDPGTGSRPAAAPTQRNIMPLSINHKPNAVAPPAEIAGPINKFFTSLKAADYVGAYDNFLAGTRLGTQVEKKSLFISKTQDAFGIYGPLRDAEVYDNYSVGSNVMVLTYLSRHDLQPLRWRFIFYRPDKTWVLINLGFDDVLLEMLD